MKLKRKHLCWGLVSCCALCERRFYWWKQQPTVLHIGVYAGSSWDVPTSQRSHALDRAIQNLKNPIPTSV